MGTIRGHFGGWSFNAQFMPAERDTWTGAPTWDGPDDAYIYHPNPTWPGLLHPKACATASCRIRRDEDSHKILLEVAMALRDTIERTPTGGYRSHLPPYTRERWLKRWLS